MAATSRWGLGAHKMTADISSPTPVASPPPAESPIKAKSYSMLEAPSKESNPNSNSNGSSNGDSGAKGMKTSAAAAAAAALSAAAAVAKRSPSSNGKGRGSARTSASAKEEAVTAVAHGRAGGDGLEAAATSSDSGGDDDEEERGGSTSAPGRAESEAGGAKATQANGHHGPLKPTVSAGGKAGNGHPEAPAARAEVDEHAARASDAAKAAVAAALASATLPVPPPHTPKPKSVAPPCKKPEEECPTASAAGADIQPRCVEGRGSEGTFAYSRTMLFLHPQWVDMPGHTETSDLERVLAAARFTPRRGADAGAYTGLFGEWIGENSSGRTEVKRDVTRVLPPPLVLPTASMPCMVGSFRVDEFEGVHRCSGTWAMTKADIDAAAHIETRASPFEFRARAGPESFPYSGAYQGYFLVRQPPKPVTRVDEDELHLSFEENSEGTWNVEGNGENIYGSFTIIGRLDAKRRLEVYRAYAKAPARGHRRASVSSHVSAAASSARGGSAPSTQGGRAPNRGKHPRSVPPSPRAQPALPSWHANGPPAASPANDANSLPPAPTARRVKRTPSYLIKDIGSDGNAHLSNGLRRCVTLLKALMNVRGKSEWFDKPVDHEGLNLFDYLDIIKRPMDLGTVRSKLEGGKYQNTMEFAADVRLVFSNARLYNSDPNSLVHIAARELFEMFETKFAALGSSLDDPPSKRRKSNGGGNASGSSNTAGSDAGQDSERDKKRKSSGGGSGSGSGKGSGDGGHGAKSGAKKARATPSSKASSPHLPSAPVSVPQSAAPPAPVAPSAMEECLPHSDNPESQLELMQRRMAEMEAQILRMQQQHAEVTAAAAAAGVTTPSQPEPLQKQSSSGSKKKSKGGSAKAGEGSKAGSKKGGSSKGGGGSKKGGGTRGGAKSEKAAADKPAKGARGSKASKAAAATARAEAQARSAAAAAANAAVAMTFDEKRALSVAINNLDQDHLTRVVEIIQASMPLGSADEEIELDIDAMDNLTLRELQAYIMELSASGSHQNGGADSDADAW